METLIVGLPIGTKKIRTHHVANDSGSRPSI